MDDGGRAMVHGRMMMIGVSECCQNGRGSVESAGSTKGSSFESSGCDPAGFRFKIYLPSLGSISEIGSKAGASLQELPVQSPVTGGRRHCRDFLSARIRRNMGELRLRATNTEEKIHTNEVGLPVGGMCKRECFS